MTFGHQLKNAPSIGKTVACFQATNLQRVVSGPTAILSMRRTTIEASKHRQSLQEDLWS